LSASLELPSEAFVLFHKPTNPPKPTNNPNEKESTGNSKDSEGLSIELNVKSNESEELSIELNVKSNGSEELSIELNGKSNESEELSVESLGLSDELELSSELDISVGASGLSAEASGILSASLELPSEASGPSESLEISAGSSGLSVESSGPVSASLEVSVETLELFNEAYVILNETGIVPIKPPVLCKLYISKYTEGYSLNIF